MLLPGVLGYSKPGLEPHHHFRRRSIRVQRSLLPHLSEGTMHRVIRLIEDKDAGDDNAAVLTRTILHLQFRIVYRRPASFPGLVMSRPDSSCFPCHFCVLVNVSHLLSIFYHTTAVCDAVFFYGSHSLSQ